MKLINEIKIQSIEAPEMKLVEHTAGAAPPGAIIVGFPDLFSRQLLPHSAAPDRSGKYAVLDIAFS